MNFIRTTPSFPRRWVVAMLAAIVAAGALILATPAHEVSARPDVDHDGNGDIVIRDTNNDHRQDS